MENSNKLTVLAIASYEKGADFLKECKQRGNTVFLLTLKNLENANWPKESIDKIYFMGEEQHYLNLKELIFSVSYIARSEKIDRIVALDDFDVEKAAALREHLRVPGMGETTARYFRDKLAMRMQAREMEIPVPRFIHALNHNAINDFIKEVEPPYVLKPRMQAGAIGLKKLNSAEEVWATLNNLGDQQSFYLIEKYIPGNIYHVDSIIYKKEIQFAIASEYGLPPMEVAHEGRVFTTRTMKKGSDDELQLQDINQKVLRAMGLVQGTSHTEFIKGKEDGKFYFLETSARVGGAHIGELVESASGVNLWREWAKIETLASNEDYVKPVIKDEYAGILISLAKQEWPDTSNYNEKEIVWRINKKHHAGLIVASPQKERVEELITNYTTRFYNDFFATQPMGDSPTN